MKLLYTLLPILYTLLLSRTCTLAGARGSHSLRAVQAKRRDLQTSSPPDWPYAFLVSHAGFVDGDDWCITAKNGVTDGSNAGFDYCQFATAPDSQLFLLDKDGKIHSKLDPTQCFVIDDGTDINEGHSRVKFCACDEPVIYSSFTHNRVTDVLRVKFRPDQCVKQNGPRPQTTDALRTIPCDETDPCFVFDYRERDCSPAAYDDVECCDDTDCPNLEICQDYECVCSRQEPDVDCCKDSDCNVGEECVKSTTSHKCFNKGSIPSTPPPCNPDDPFTECCNNTDCLTGYECRQNTCVTPAFFLINTIDGKDYCVAANRGIGEFAEVGSEECNFETNPPSQLWHGDTHNMIRSNIDVDRCILVGKGQDIHSGLGVHIASCKLNMFVYDTVTDLFHLGEDTSYCLMTSQPDGQDPLGNICGKACKKNDSTFTFSKRYA